MSHFWQNHVVAIERARGLSIACLRDSMLANETVGLSPRTSFMVVQLGPVACRPLLPRLNCASFRRLLLTAPRQLRARMAESAWRSSVSGSTGSSPAGTARAVASSACSSRPASTARWWVTPLRPAATPDFMLAHTLIVQ
jgi:hypothetical protein